MPQRQRRVRGLTLIELVVVITILSFLMVAVSVYAIGQLVDARKKTARLDVKTAANALDLYRASRGRYPDPRDGFQPVVEAKALKELPRDPWGHPLVWRLEGGAPVVVSLGADGVSGGADEDADISSND